MSYTDHGGRCICERPDAGYDLPDQRAVFYIPDEDEDADIKKVTITIERHYTDCPECGCYGYLRRCTFRVAGPGFTATCSSENQAFNVVKAAFPTAEYDAEQAREARLHAQGIEW